jgi:hypothetical protein
MSFFTSSLTHSIYLLPRHVDRRGHVSTTLRHYASCRRHAIFRCPVSTLLLSVYMSVSGVASRSSRRGPSPQSWLRMTTYTYYNIVYCLLVKTPMLGVLQPLNSGFFFFFFFFFFLKILGHRGETAPRFIPLLFYFFQASTLYPGYSYRRGAACWLGVLFYTTFLLNWAYILGFPTRRGEFERYDHKDSRRYMNICLLLMENTTKLTITF